MTYIDQYQNAPTTTSSGTAVTTAPDTVPGQLTHQDIGGGMPPTVTAEDVRRQEQAVNDFMDNGDQKAAQTLMYPGLLRMPKRILQQLWKESLHMPEATYCMLAMYADGIGSDQELKPFDADAFIERWAIYWETEKKGKKGSVEYVPHEKKITHATVAKVISSFEKKDRAIARRYDVQLKITWEA